MNDKTYTDRAKGAILGTLIGDALGVGPHWYYDLEQLKADYGPWIDDYTAPKPDRYHGGLKAGQYSQTGQVVVLLMESLAEYGEYRESDLTDRLDGLLATLDGSPTGGRYTDEAMRDLWQARKNGKGWSETGSLADTAEAAIRTPILAARYFQDLPALKKVLSSNIRLTHIDPFIAGQSTAFGMIVGALIHGTALPEVSKQLRSHATKGLSFQLDAPEFPGTGECTFIDAVLHPTWIYEAAGDEAVSIEPAHAACRLFGLACTLGFMLPAAYYFASRFEGDFEKAVLSAVNGGGNNMARAALTGAISGAQVGLSGIPDRFLKKLENNDRLQELADRIVG
jgi:ADP-ribosylglycohydrolase